MKISLIFAAAILTVLLLVACNNGGSDGSSVPTPGVTISIGIDGTPVSDETIDVVAEEVCQTNPNPATAEDQVVDEPGEGDTVTSPVTISGQVRAFEGTYQVVILDTAGDPIVDPLFGTAGPGEIGELAPFSIDVPFEVDEATPACIWVYELSAMDGSQINIGQIPVLLSP